MSQTSPLVSWGIKTAESESDLSLSMGQTSVSIIDEGARQLLNYALHLSEYIDNEEVGTIKLEKTNDCISLLEEAFIFGKSYFTYKDNILSRYFLPWPEYHKSQHADILELIHENLSTLKRGQLHVTPEFRTKWISKIIDHINKVDCPTFSPKFRTTALLSSKNCDDLQLFVNTTGIQTVDHDVYMLVKSLSNAANCLSYYDGKNLSDEDWVKAQQIFSQFYKDVCHHFGSQEEYIKRLGLSGLLQHRQKHYEFQRSIYSFCTKLKSKEAKLNKQVQIGMLNWWINHFNNDDRITFSYKIALQNILEERNNQKEIEWFFPKLNDKLFESDYLSVAQKLSECSLHLEAKNKGELLIALNETFKLISELFAKEEDLNSLHCSLPHRKEHTKLLHRMKNLASDIEKGRVGLNRALVEDIISLFLIHCQKFDNRDYSLFTSFKMTRKEEKLAY